MSIAGGQTFCTLFTEYHWFFYKEQGTSFLLILIYFGNESQVFEVVTFEDCAIFFTEPLSDLIKPDFNFKFLSDNKKTFLELMFRATVSDPKDIWGHRFQLRVLGSL